MKSNVKKIASVLLSVAMLFGMCALVSVSAAETSGAVGAALAVTGSSNYCTASAAAAVSVGQTITVSFTAPSDLSAVSIQWGMNYDKTKLSYQKTTSFTDDMLVNPNATSYSVIGSASSNSAPYQVSAGSVLLSFTFKALADGETNVYLHMVDLMNRGQNGEDTIVVQNGVPADEQEVAFTVNATSNFFAPQTNAVDDITSYRDANGNIFVTVEYKLFAADQYIMNVDLDELTYDPKVLEWKEEYNTAGTTLDMFPFAAENGFGTGTVNKTADGRVVGNYASIKPAAPGYGEGNTAVTVVKATFKLLDVNAGSTTVNCVVDTLSFCDTSEANPYLKSIAIDKKVVNAEAKAKATYTTVISTGQKQEVLLGDVDRNGKVDINDATCLQRYLAEFISSYELNLKAADVNGDKKVDVRDVTAIQRILAEKA